MLQGSINTGPFNTFPGPDKAEQDALLWF